MAYGIASAVTAHSLISIGERAGARTQDPVIKSHVLYQLSYALAQRAKTVETVEPDLANPAMPTQLSPVGFTGPRTEVVPAMGRVCRARIHWHPRPRCVGGAADPVNRGGRVKPRWQR